MAEKLVRIRHDENDDADLQVSVNPVPKMANARAAALQTVPLVPDA